MSSSNVDLLWYNLSNYEVSQFIFFIFVTVSVVVYGKKWPDLSRNCEILIYLIVMTYEILFRDSISLLRDKYFIIMTKYLVSTRQESRNYAIGESIFFYFCDTFRLSYTKKMDRYMS